MLSKKSLAIASLAMVLLAGSFVASGQSGLRIIYITYASNQDEVVVIFNANPVSIDMTGYKLWSQGGQQFVFGVSSLNPQTPTIGAFDIVRVHCRMCDVPSDPRDFRWQKVDGGCYQASVWNNKSDSAKLFAPGSDVPINEYSYP